MKSLSAGKSLLCSIRNAAKEVGGVYFITCLDIVWSGIRYGASPNNYVNFDFRHASVKERKTFLTHQKNEFLMKKFNNSSEVWKLENKYEFARMIGHGYGRSFARTDTITLEELMHITGNGRIIYKPLQGGQGIGIKVFNTNDYKDADKFLTFLHDLPVGIIEQWIDQEETLSELYPDAVNPIRIQSLYTDKVHIMAATITIANGTDIANASGVKAIFGLVDVNDGSVYTDGYDYNGCMYVTHPLTGIKIRGFQIPRWKEVLELIDKSARKFPQVRHIGWDIAITKEGPVIIEANNDPGYTAYQLPQLTGNHTGIWPLYKEYL